MKTLKEIFASEIVEFLKNNKDQITGELLEELRSFGNEGKHLALEILDFQKDSEQYYLDSFGNRISFNGNRQLKRQFTKLDLSPIHIEELQRCADDIHYFKDNYIKIRTKSGVNFPELRKYQNDFINEIIPDENESVIGLMGRQCCSGETKIKISQNNIEREMNFEELFNECKTEFITNNK